MTDLEIVRRCAERMELDVVYTKDHIMGAGFYYEVFSGTTPQGNVMGLSHYDPLHDDAQAMGLLKHFNLMVSGQIEGEPCDWRVWGNGHRETYIDANLNRAICKCVAKITE